MHVFATTTTELPSPNKYLFVSEINQTSNSMLCHHIYRLGVFPSLYQNSTLSGKGSGARFSDITLMFSLRIRSLQRTPPSSFSRRTPTDFQGQHPVHCLAASGPVANTERLLCQGPQRQRRREGERGNLLAFLFKPIQKDSLLWSPFRIAECLLQAQRGTNKWALWRLPNNLGCCY